MKNKKCLTSTKQKQNKNILVVSRYILSLRLFSEYIFKHEIIWIYRRHEHGGTKQIWTTSMYSGQTTGGFLFFHREALAFKSQKPP